MAKDNSESQTWDLVITPRTGLLDLHLIDLWRYRDLVLMFVKRDFVAQYKQTILGPIWYLIQPLFSSTIFTIIFSFFAKLSTDGIPPFLFYMSGTVLWNYFANCLNSTSNTFIQNASLFGKVYFPRLAVPVSVVISNLIQLAIQFSLLACVYAYFAVSGMAIQITPAVLWLPVLVLQMALLGLGAGILVSSLTTKYRDLMYLLSFGVQLWMYATPVVYPFSQVPERFRHLYQLNPMVAIIERFRAAVLGTPGLPLQVDAVSWLLTAAILFAGLILFYRTQRTFMDTI